MIKSFDTNVLKYMFQKKNTLNFIKYIEPKIFVDEVNRIIFTSLKKYIYKYKSIPNKQNFLHYLKQTSKISKQDFKELKKTISYYYLELTDYKIVEEHLLNKIKSKMFSILITEGIDISDDFNTDSFAQHEDKIESFHKRVRDIKNLDINSFAKSSKGIFLISDLNKKLKRRFSAHPFFLDTVNKMTSLGGFYAPQLVVFMGAPKSFKTGFLIKSGVEYMRDGLNVFYADLENGEENIFMRHKQCLLECAANEIVNFNDELNEIKEKLLMINAGEIYIERFRKKLDNFEAIDAKLEFLHEEHGFKPDFIISDYIDLMGKGKDLKTDDKRLIIQHNYAMADNINEKYGCFQFTVSKLKREAIKKEWVSAEDAAEDFEKIYNAHAVFALMRSEEEIELNTGRLIPVVQREGASYLKIACNLEIDAENFVIKEMYLD